MRKSTVWRHYIPVRIGEPADVQASNSWNTQNDIAKKGVIPNNGGTMPRYNLSSSMDTKVWHCIQAELTLLSRREQLFS